MVITSYVEESPTKRSLSVEVPADEVRLATDLVARQLAKQLRLPGFRPGKVPVDVVRKRFAEELKGEVVESLVRDALQQALAEKELVPVGSPKVEDVRFEAGQPLTFRADLEIRPVVAPKDYRGLKIPSEPTTPGEDEIAAFLDRLREGRAAFHPIEDRPAADGDFALVDIHGVFPEGDGKDFDHEKVLVELGGAETLPELSAHLRNAEPGATVSFQKDFPSDAADQEFAGKVVLYTVTLHALKSRSLPEMDDELARQILAGREGELPEGAGLPMLREQVVKSLAREKEAALKEKQRRAALDGLLALNPVDAPDTLVEAEVDGMLKEYARFLSRQGIDLKEAKTDWNKVREEFRPGAVRRVKEWLLLDAIGEAEKISVTETELDAELKRRAPQFGITPSELKASLAKAERLDGIREELRMGKVVDFLLTEAVTAGGA